MNNDLISKSELLEKLVLKPSLGGFIHSKNIDDAVNECSVIDAKPVRHGRYGFVGPHIGSTYSPYAEHGTCSECKERILIDPQHKNYCPN